MRAICFRAVGMRILAAASAVCLVMMIGCGDGKKAVTPPKGDGPPATSPVDIQLPSELPGSGVEKPAEPKAEPKPEEKPAEPKAEPKPEEKPAEPMAEPKPEEKPAEPKAEPKPEEKPAEPKAEPKPEEKPAEPMAEPKPEEKPAEPKAEPKPEEKPAEPKAEPKPEEKPAEPKAEPKPEEKPAEPKAEPKPEEKPVAPSGDSAANQPSKVGGIEIPEKHKLSLEPTLAFLNKKVKPTSNPDAEASDEAGMKPYKETISGAEVSFEMVPIKGGKYLRGSPDTEEGRKPDEGPQHEVEIEPFWMGKCEVTWEEYELWCLKLDIQRRKLKNQEPTENDQVADAIAMPTNPYTDMSFGMGKDGYPAICMTQLSAKMYCKWLSAKTGRYYRLPTEAEWEYACRAGTTTAYSFGDDPSKLDEYAWYLDNSDDKYHKVGQKKPNPWGLHDMHGNVAEWVLDQYAADAYKQFAGKVTRNPFVPGTTEFDRVVRGGSWDDEAPALRSAARRSSEKIWKQQDPQIPQSVWYLTDATFVGFRVVRPLRTPTPEEAKLFELDDQQIEEFLDYDKAQAGKM